MTTDPMSFFSENVDSWGAAEWFDRMCKAAHAQDEAVRTMYAATHEHEKAEAELRFETFKMIVSSSARRLVEYEASIRSALALPAVPEGWKLVPVEPKPEMLGAWYRYKNGHHWPDEPVPPDTSDYGAYRAMLTAAPEASYE